LVDRVTLPLPTPNINCPSSGNGTTLPPLESDTINGTDDVEGPTISKEYVEVDCAKATEAQQGTVGSVVPDVATALTDDGAAVAVAVPIDDVLVIVPKLLEEVEEVQPFVQALSCAVGAGRP
jgi:hypothetical protein